MSEAYNSFIKDFPGYAGFDMIERAFDMAERAHAAQKRKSGEPYFVHPCHVARILAELGLDPISITAGLLHDVPEDTEITVDEIREQFGDEVARIVDGVTKLKQFEFQSREEQQAESLRKMFLAMASDIRVVIIKLADRLHNMRTLNYTSEEKQKEKAKETLEIYAPLADRLGISAIRWELEDYALKYLEPEAYDEIAAKLKETRKQREKYIDAIITQVRERVAALGIDAEIYGRPKHIYSIYRKLHDKHKTFEELYDLIAIRIIVDSVKDCYAVLGAVHTLWRPLPMRFKDYIAVPKVNMYQSLHTTLLGGDGRPFEVQIRTKEMHMTAEYGIAAHWKYKDGGKVDSTGFEDKLSWLGDLMEWQKELKDSREFMETVKYDFFSDYVFVFTPKGEVKDFVKGSTPLDFAYSIHSEIGNKCTGAKVNGRLVPLNYELKTGDIVDIMTSASHKGPSRDWLNMVKTAQARGKIRQWFKKELKEENIQKGKEMLEREAKRQGFDLFALQKPEWLKSIYNRFTLNSVEDMYAAVGYGGLSTNQILSRLIHQHNFESKQEAREQARIEKTAQNQGQKSASVKVLGQSDMLVRIAKCCNPLPGDSIIGYVTRGRGVTVHRSNCPNVKNEDAQRRIEVSWDHKGDTKFTVEIQVLSNDRDGLIVELTQLIYSLGYSIASMNAVRSKNRTCTMNFSIEVTNISDLERIIAKLMQIPDVFEAFRVYK